MKLLILLVSVMAACSVAFGQVSVQVRPSVSVNADSAVTLGDVAIVTGDDAAGLNNLVLVPADRTKLGTPGSTLTIKIDRANIKAALEKAGVNWGKTTLTGGSSTVTVSARGETEAPIQANTPMVPIDDAGTLRSLIARQIAASNDVLRDDLRIRFDQLSPADVEWVNQPVNAAWHYEIRTLGSSPTGKTPVRIEAYQRDTQMLARTITIEALIRRDTPVAAGPLVRDQLLTEADISVESKWVPIGSGRPAQLGDLIGSAVKRRIESGRPITPSDVQAPLVVKRGDEVWVHCISGGMVIKTKARSLGSARNGEMVSLQVDGSKKTFSARMNGRGRAVMNLDGVADESASDQLLLGKNP